MENQFNNIAIIYNKELKQAYDLAIEINKKIENSIIYSLDNMQENADLAIIIGGDGTFLKASRFYSKFQVPVFGFNVGRLGYLAQAKRDEIDNVVKKLKAKEYKIENRIMLQAQNHTALNDIVIKGALTTRTSTLNLYINNKHLCSYVADGLIISTPTGSTAYSLSAGGPVIEPSLNCFIIIPICPHTLNTRPIVIPKNEKIIVKAEDENQKLNICFDGQVEIICKKEIKIQKNNNNTQLLILNQQKDVFYDILKEKLQWFAPIKK